MTWPHDGMSFTFQDRRALITGASSGIGRALALELARAGVDSVVVARREALLAELAGEIEQIGRKAVVVAGDITDPDVRTRALDAAQRQLGGLDLLVNNAGVSAHGRFHQAGPERLRQIMEVNFFAPAELMRAAVPLLRKSPQPAVVNVSSILGRRGLPWNSEYCASKFALQGLSEAVRPELAKLGIGLLVVSPGTTDTEFFDHLIEKQGEIPWTQSRGVSAEAVARATLDAIRCGKREITPNLRGRMLLWAHRLAPRTLDRWLRRYG